MPSILNLKFKGNKSFVAFSNLADADSLTKTWKVCTKVASYLEQGQRLENLSWRLWHLQNLMVDTDNAKSKREFKKLSKHMGDKLDKEKGRSIEELQAPGFRRNQSTDMIQLRAAEKERNRLASLHATPGTIKRMQFTFSVEQPSGSSEAQPLTVAKPDLKPSSEFKDGSHKRSRPSAVSSSSSRQVPTSSSSSHTTPTPNHTSSSMSMDVDGMDQPLTQRGMKPLPSPPQPAADGSYNPEWTESGLRFPSLFSNDFGPTALLNPSPSVRGSLSYGEDVVATLSSSADAFGIIRPTLELPLDDILSTLTDSPEPYAQTGKMDTDMFGPDGILPYDLGGQEMYGAVDAGASAEHVLGPVQQHQHQQTMSPPPVPSKEPKTVSPSKLGPAPPASLGEQPRPRLTLKTSSGGGSRAAGNAGLGATASAATSSTNGTGQSSSNGKSGTSSAPGGVKAECSNCGATHTPLWRRGLNDELNCNACGLYCKLHKRPRPKSMRNNHSSSSSNNPSSSAASSSSASQSDSRAHGSSAAARAAAAQAAQATQADAAQESMGVGSMGHVGGRPRSGSASIVGSGSAQCYNCHTTTTPLWRKDDEGKTVCNACGLYYKLHGSARPISMKSDVIRKRSRHDAARRSIAETPSASPGASRRNSPVGDNGVATVSTPTFAPDSTTQVFEYDFQPAQSELMGALGDAGLSGQSFGSAVAAAAGLAAFGAFPGPYHPDYLMKNYGDMMSIYAAGGTSSVTTTNHGQDEDGERANKRRRMSNVSTTSSSTDPPLSAASSYSSYESAGYASSAPTSVSSSRSSGGLPGSGSSSANGANGNGAGSSNGTNGAVDFPYAQYNSYGLMRAAGPSAFWHPPMLPQTHSPSASFVHPPMLPPSDDGEYGYGQQQAQQQQQQQQQQQAQQSREDVDGLFSTYLHPPMILPESPELGGGLTSLHGLKGVHPPMLPPDYADIQTGY